MTIAELIECLENKDPDMKVAMATDAQGSHYVFAEESGVGLIADNFFYRNEDELERYGTDEPEETGLRCFVLWPEQ